MGRDRENDRLAREGTREAILRSAVAQFAARGVDGTTLAEIARHAHVAHGLVNYHFGSKANLVRAVVDRWHENENLALSGVTSPDDILARIIDRSVAAAERDPLARAVRIIESQPTTRHIAAESQAQSETEDHSTRRIARSLFTRRGVHNAELEAAMLTALLDGITLRRLVDGHSFPLEEARRWVFQLYGLDEAIPSEDNVVVTEGGQTSARTTAPSGKTRDSG